ncbi:MAG: cytochrome b/b6 domain-containing protein [Eggerthellaceae bacterium]|nr:cytochrome b/b6 domain-containing protein [Eggerthellaceae bacterium]
MSEMEITNPAAKQESGVEVKIFKHRVASRIMHGFVAVSFCTLLITGILLVAGVDFARGASAFLHCIMGFVLIAAPIVYIIGCYKNFARFMDTCTHYDKDDWGWVKAPMGGYLDPYLFRNQPPHYVPPQDKYNTGQKGAGICLILGCVVLGATGFLMWANTPEGIFGIINLELGAGMTWFLWRLHLVTAVCTAAVFAVHFFLGAIYPVTNVEFGTMFGNGIADYAYTKKKHGKWLNTLEVREEKEVQD